MKNNSMRALASLAAVLFLFAMAWVFLSIPAKARVIAEEAPSKTKIGSFHVHDRHDIDTGGVIPPHKENKRLRAFLNLHVAALDCSVCHLSAAGARVEKLKNGKLGLVGSMGAAGPLSEKDPGTIKLALGKRCGECHKRGSPLLTSNYFGARLRVLEDLSILRYLGED